MLLLFYSLILQIRPIIYFPFSVPIFLNHALKKPKQAHFSDCKGVDTVDTGRGGVGPIESSTLLLLHDMQAN